MIINDMKKNNVTNHYFENNVKNSKLKDNQRKSFYSSSSFGKNFILKNKICKSTKNNNNSDNNPIMTYFIGKN